jgi:hypothetical protein
MTSLTIAYTPEYRDWQLGADHPTDPRRAQISTALLADWGLHSELRGTRAVQVGRCRFLLDQMPENDGQLVLGEVVHRDPVDTEQSALEGGVPRDPRVEDERRQALAGALRVHVDSKAARGVQLIPREAPPPLAEQHARPRQESCRSVDPQTAQPNTSAGTVVGQPARLGRRERDQFTRNPRRLDLESVEPPSTDRYDRLPREPSGPYDISYRQREESDELGAVSGLAGHDQSLIADCARRGLRR